MSSLLSAVAQCLAEGPHEKASGTTEAVFLFPQNFLGFQGHFPHKSIVPGIAQIMAAIVIASPARGSEGSERLAVVRRAKFMGMVKPEQTMRVQVQRKAVEGGSLLTVACSTENGPCAQFKLLMEVCP